MHKTSSESLQELISKVLLEMERIGYCQKYVQQVRCAFKALKALADKMGIDTLDDELVEAFVGDFFHFRTGEYSESRFKQRNLVVRMLRTYQETRALDYPPRRRLPILSALTAPQFFELHSSFAQYLQEAIGLKKNTIDGYKRFVHHFLLYCEENGYRTVQEIQKRDVLVFLEALCRDRYQPSSIGAHLPGLKRFFSMSKATSHLLSAIPRAPKRKKEIINVLEEWEQKAFSKYLRTANISARNRAICWLAFETGMRAIDINNLKLTDIDWANDKIHVRQQKTSTPLELPLRATYGNAIADYLLYERPKSDSKRLFLSMHAPFKPLSSHGVCRAILLKAFREANILDQERICGTRFTRHNAASHMLKNGVPLYDISATLGHVNPSSVEMYLAMDDQMMAQCCLPVPLMEGGLDNE